MIKLIEEKYRADWYKFNIIKLVIKKRWYTVVNISKLRIKSVVINLFIYLFIL